LNFEYGIPVEKESEIGIAIKGRYSIIEGLEAALSLPIPLSYSYNDGDSPDGYVGLSTPEIGVRYWLPMGLGFYLDFGLPVDTRYDKEPKEIKEFWKAGIEPAMELAVGAQFSTNFTEELSLGSQLGVKVPFERADSKVQDGMALVVGVELDYSIGAVTPYLGAELEMGLTTGAVDGTEIPGDPAPAGIDLWIGVAYSINDMFGCDVYANFGLLEGKGGEDNTPITIGFNFDFKF